MLQLFTVAVAAQWTSVARQSLWQILHSLVIYGKNKAQYVTIKQA